MSINYICDAFYGSIVVSANGLVERRNGPNMEPQVLETVIAYFKETPCDVPLIKILGILAQFKYNEKYESAFGGGGGMPSYVADSHKNIKIINQAIDYVYVTAKYEGSS